LWIGDATGFVARPSYSTQTIILISFITVAIFFYLSKPKLQPYFLHLYLASIAVKLIAYCAYNFLIIVRDRSNAFANVIVFLIVYLIFTGIEIAFLYRKITRATRP
jgi:4-amino-4-deoxy-L-arabinose transferase-like glycosyltransferase